MFQTAGLADWMNSVGFRDRQKSSKVPPGCCVEPIAAFQLAYQGYPWKPAKGYEILSGFSFGVVLQEWMEQKVGFKLWKQCFFKHPTKIQYLSLDRHQKESQL